MTREQPHEPTTEVGDGQRPIAPGGWRRAVLGVLVGALIGAAIAFVLPRDDLPRRSVDPER